MAEPLGGWARSHTCGALRLDDVGREVVLLGWVHRLRDLGSLVFVDIRDRTGLTQIVVRDNEVLVSAAQRLRSEYVIGVRGMVQRRASDTVNPKLETGDIEVVAAEVRVLNEARTPPFSIVDDTPISEDTRLRYRYLDLRRPRLQANLGLRHRVAMAVRKHFDAQGFWEVETPILTKSTPEGARDYLVPSRVHPGTFYALPQSPQLFKQILMISGVDRYFQIVKCFRDEDLRADRQPEFTQIDVEIAFATQELVFGLIEPLMEEVLRVAGRTTVRPFPRMSYADAIARYGSDKPDLRCGMPIVDLTALFSDTSFAPFREILDASGVVRGFVVVGAAQYSRRELDELVDQAKQIGMAGLIWARRSPEGAVQSSALKALGEQDLGRALGAAEAGAGDLLVLAAGKPIGTSKRLGQLRLAVAKQQGLLKSDDLAFLWVLDFPLLEWNEDEKRFDAMHHPFTSPIDEDFPLLDSDPGRVRAQAYDLVLSGNEISSGSIRVHDSALQNRIFGLLNISEEDARKRFGFFLDALQYGTPPHGGLALGLDRIIAILAGESSIREVIAFPKTAAAVDLMTGSPSSVDARQLRELHLKTEP